MLKVSTMSIFFRLLRQSKKIKLNNRIKRNKSTMKLRIKMLSRLILRLRRKSRLLLDIGIKLKNWLNQRLKSRLNRQSRLRKKRLSMPSLKRLTMPRLKSLSRLRLRSQSTPRRILLKKLSQKNRKPPSNRLRSK
jgi:hypothetical protein